MWGKRNYGAKKVETDGYSFASGLEAATYQHLKLLQSAGEITIIKTQDSVYLSKAKILYKPDFKCKNTKTDEEFWVEAKGFETDVWRIKRRLWIAYGPGALCVYRGTKHKVFLHETIRGGGENESKEE